MSDKKPFDWINASDDEREVESILKMHIIGNEIVSLIYGLGVMTGKGQQLEPSLMKLIADFPCNLNEYANFLTKASLLLEKQQEQINEVDSLGCKGV